jgi:hypothetical protein
VRRVLRKNFHRAEGGANRPIVGRGNARGGHGMGRFRCQITYAEITDDGMVRHHPAT